MCFSNAFLVNTLESCAIILLFRSLLWELSSFIIQSFIIVFIYLCQCNTVISALDLQYIGPVFNPWSEYPLTRHYFLLPTLSMISDIMSLSLISSCWFMWEGNQSQVEMFFMLQYLLQARKEQLGLKLIVCLPLMA